MLNPSLRRNKTRSKKVAPLKFRQDLMSKITLKDLQIDRLEKNYQAKDEVIKSMQTRQLQLENDVDDLEQYSRVDDLLISGLSTTHRSYSSVAAGVRDEDTPPSEQLSLEKQVLQFFAEHNMSLEPSAISACHTLQEGRQRQ